MADKYAHVRELENEAVALFTAAYRQWWRPWRNRKRYAEARRLLAQAGRELDLITAQRRAAARSRRWDAALAVGFQREAAGGDA